MSLPVALLRESFDLVLEREPELTRRFYEIFFARYPQVVPMFGRNTRVQQERMLAQALGALLDHLDDATWLTSALPALGAKHVAYGVTDEMYDWVGECLLAAMANAAGELWTAELAAAWSAAYGAVAGLMQQGARELAVTRAA